MYNYNIADMNIFWIKCRNWVCFEISSQTNIVLHITIFTHVFSSSSYYTNSQIIKTKQGMWLCPRNSIKWSYYQWIKYIYIWYFTDGKCRKTFPFVDTVLSGLSIAFHETACFLQIQDIFEKLLTIIKKQKSLRYISSINHTQ